MVKIDEKTIKKLTTLCRIDCTEAEQKQLLINLEKILQHCEQLNELDTTGVPACNHVLEDLNSMMREDKIGEVLNREEFLANAPLHIGGMIRIPPFKTKS